MRDPPAIELHGRPLGGGKVPHVCAPLVGRSREAVLEELRIVLSKGPDLVEWRVDGFEGIGSAAEVVRLAGELRQRAGPTPILFTRRSTHEGGEPIPIGEEAVIELYEAVCASRSVDLVDYELSQPAENMARLRDAARRSDVRLVASFHDFQRTPPQEALVERFQAAERSGADVAKVAVMARGLDDVLTLLGATLKARQALRIPIITMSMGPLGSLARMFGWVFGSSVTFAIGDAGSAPGQVPIEDVRTVVEVLRRALGDAP